MFPFLIFLFSKFHLVVPSPASDVLFGVCFADGLVVLVALVVLCGTLSHFVVLFVVLPPSFRLRLAVVRKIQRETYCCTIIFAVWRGFLWRRELWWMNVYATTITSLARGKHGRWMAHVQRLVRDDPRIPLLVVRIQQRVRGMQSRGHQMEARRNLKRFRFLVKLGMWMLRIKRRRDCLVVVQSIVRRRLAYVYGVPRGWQAWVVRTAIKLQGRYRGKLGRRLVDRWGRGIRRWQAVVRSIKSRWVSGQALRARLGAGAARDERERRYVSGAIGRAVKAVKDILCRRKGSHLISVQRRVLHAKQRALWCKRLTLRWRMRGVLRGAVLRRATLSVLFAKYDYNQDGRLTVRAFKNFIVDELCVPLTPVAFQQLVTLLDGRTVVNSATKHMGSHGLQVSEGAGRRRRHQCGLLGCC